MKKMEQRQTCWICKSTNIIIDDADDVYISLEELTCRDCQKNFPICDEEGCSDLLGNCSVCKEKTHLCDLNTQGICYTCRWGL